MLSPWCRPRASDPEPYLVWEKGSQASCRNSPGAHLKASQIHFHLFYRVWCYKGVQVSKTEHSASYSPIASFSISSFLSLLHAKDQCRNLHQRHRAIEGDTTAPGLFRSRGRIQPFLHPGLRAVRMLLTSRANPCFLSPSVLQQSYFCRETDFRFTQSTSQGFFICWWMLYLFLGREQRKQTENKNQLPLNEEHSVLLRAWPPFLSGLGVSLQVPRRCSRDAGSWWPHQHLSP